MEELIEEHPTRFVGVEPVSSSVSWQVMADFVEGLPAGDARDKLTHSLQASKPFGRFKRALLDYPDLRQKWFAFEYSSWLEIARNWMEREGIEAKLTTRSID